MHCSFLIIFHPAQAEKISPTTSSSPAQITEGRGGSPDSISSIGSSVASRNSHLQPAAPHMSPYHAPSSPARLQSSPHGQSPRQANTSPVVKGNHSPHISQQPQPGVPEQVSHQMGYSGLQTQPRPLYPGQAPHLGYAQHSFPGQQFNQPPPPDPGSQESFNPAFHPGTNYPYSASIQQQQPPSSNQPYSTYQQVS